MTEPNKHAYSLIGGLSHTSRGRETGLAGPQVQRPLGAERYMQRTNVGA